MAWVNLDDQFFSHPKTAHLMIEAQDGLRAIGLWTLALSWAHAHTRRKPPDQQGVIPAMMIRQWDRSWGAVQQAAADLVAADLWKRLEDGSYRIHQFREWNGLDQHDARVRGGKMTAAKRWGTPDLFDSSDSSAIAVATSSPIGGIGGDGSSLVAVVAPPTPTPTPTKSKHLSAAADDFDDFWSAYPRRIGKDAARRRWATVITKARPADVIAGARAFAELCAAKGTQAKFIPHPATWLNAGRWMDDAAGGDGEAGVPPWDRPGYVRPAEGFGSDD